ncbi:MAG: G5 domain-containing protein [Ardenticatenales bacterium]|nr:G5 domain-containing protein [Ardenticatenales bacterium]
MKRIASSILLLLGLLVLLAGCAEQPATRVLLEVDGARRWVSLTDEASVSDLLDRAAVHLDALDRVEPSSFTLLEPEMLVRVIRVRARELQEEQALPFPREVRRDASLSQGESRLVQLGQNGLERITLRVTLEDGVEVKREVAGRETLTTPTAEVLVVGTKGTGEAVSFEGTIVYMEQGNAWMMRGDSTLKRALTRTGDLDGHVFALSPDGRWLLFTREPLGGASGQGGPLNSLWLVSTRITNDEPRSMELNNVLWADWQPCPPIAGECPLQVAFSSGERVPTPPGWRAHNDLRRFGMNSDGIRGEEVPILLPSNPLLGWWGRTWAWSPDGAHIAWGDATRIGIVDVASGEARILAEFIPFETRASWVWTPQLTWTPNGRALFTLIHRAADEQQAASAEGAEYSERFDLWRIPLSGGSAEPILEGIGPFAMPRWLDPARLFYGQAEDAAHSLTSRYNLMVQEGDSLPRHLFPPQGQPGVDVPWSAWNPLDDALIALWQGDIYLVPLSQADSPRPLTGEGQASRPEWGP